MSSVEKVILFLGNTFTGRNHDYSMLKQEFPPEHDWFDDLNILVDLAYLGMSKDYRSENILLPHKKTTQEQEKSSYATYRGTKNRKSCTQWHPHLCRKCNWWHQALQYLGSPFS